MGIKTKHAVGVKIKSRFGVSNKKSFNSAELPSLEKSPFRLKNVSLFTSQQPANLFGFGTTQTLLEEHSQSYIPLIIFVGQKSAVHISGDGFVTGSVSAKPVTDNNTEMGPCYCTNAGAVRTDIPSNLSFNKNSDINANVTNSKEGCCCESFKDISLEERKTGQNHQTEISQSTHDGIFKFAGRTDIFKYSPVTQIETIVQCGREVRIETKHQCITAMQIYEDTSLEELRLAEYLAQNNGNATEGHIHSFGHQSNITSNVFNTNTSAGGINACRKPISTSFSKPVSNFTFGPPSTFNITSNLASIASPATGIYTFGQQAVATFGKSVSNFTFGQPSSEKVDGLLSTNTAETSLPSAITSTAGTSLFGKPNFTSINNPELNSLFKQPLMSNTTSNILTTTTSATGTSIFGKPISTSVGKSVSNFTFGQPSSEKVDGLLSTNTAETSLPSAITSTAGTSLFGKPNFTSINNPELNSLFKQPLMSNTTSNILTTTTSATGTSIFGKPISTSVGKSVSNFTFGQPSSEKVDGLLSTNTAETSLPSAITSTAGTSLFGKPNFTSINNPELNSLFKQPLMSNTTSNILTTTTSATGTSIFGKPISTSVGKPVSKFNFGQPLTSSTTNNESNITPFAKPVSNFTFGWPLTSSTTNNGPNITPFGKPASNFTFGQPLTSSTTNNEPNITPFGKPVSNFTFGQPLTFSTTNNEPNITPFGQPASNFTSGQPLTSSTTNNEPNITPFGKPVSNFTFGQPLTSSTTNNEPNITAFGKPVSNFSFGHPSNTTKDLPITTTSAVKINIPPDFGFKWPPISKSIDSLSSTTSSGSGICTFGDPNNDPLSKSTSNFRFGRQFTSDVKKPPTSSATGVTTSRIPLNSSGNNGVFSSATDTSNSTELFNKPTTSIKSGLPISSNSTNDLHTPEATQKITGIFGQQIEDKCVPPPMTSSSATRSIFSSKPTSGFNFNKPAAAEPFKYICTQPPGQYFNQQTSKRSFPSTNLSSVRSCFVQKPENVFDKPNANFANQNHGNALKNSNSWSPLTTQVFPGFTPSPFSTAPVFNTAFKWKNNNPFNIKTTGKTGRTDLFNQTTFNPNQSGFTSFPSTMKNTSHFCSCNKPPFVLTQSSNFGFENKASKPDNCVFAWDNNVSSNTAVVCPFCQTYFDRTQSNHFRKASLEQQNWPQFRNKQSPVCLFCSKIVQEVQPFQGHSQQQNTSFPFNTTTQNTRQCSFFSQSNTPDINLDEVPSLAVICATPGNVFCSIGSGTNNIFGNLEQNTSCERLGTKLCPYYPQFENDILTNGKVKINCITRMKEYENKSLEELRFEDYLINYKNRQAATMNLIIGQVQSTLAQLSRSINDKSITNTFGQ